MKVMILAAGRGERMGPLTVDRPKPMLPVAGMPLIEYHVRALAAAGFFEIVINTAYLGHQLVEYLGDGHRFGVSIVYSPEPEGALGTGGGIGHALPLLGDEPFLVVNSDIWTDFPFFSLKTAIDHAVSQEDALMFGPPVEKFLAHLVMVPNPRHNRTGDFGFSGGHITPGHDQRFTYSGIGVYRPELFADQQGVYALGPLLRRCIVDHTISGQLYDGRWWDVGTVQRLHHITSFLQGSY